jgi:hypothetical protein
MAVAAVALSASATASAMPAQVSSRWYGNMMHRLEIMAGNGGFCSAFPQVWVCSYDF